MSDILFHELYNILISKIVKTEFTRFIADQIYSFVIKEIEDFYRIHGRNKSIKFDKSKIEDCKIKVSKIINLFRETDKKRDKFLIKFPVWKHHREENIELLNKIAKDLHDEKKIMNAVNVISSVVGAAGGAAILASIFFPPATIVNIPAWLGGSAVAAFLPASILSVVGTTTAATSALAVGGGAAAVANGASKIITSVTELKLLKENMDKAEAILSKEKEMFEDIKELFDLTDSLTDVLMEMLNFNTLEHMFGVVFEFLDLVKTFPDKLNEHIQKDLRGLFHKCIVTLKLFIDIPYDFCLALLGILFISFLVFKKNCFLFNSIVGVCQIMNGNLSLVSAFTALTTTSAVTSAELAPQVMARNIRLGAFTGIGIALDVITIVKGSLDMKEGSKSDYGKKIEEASSELKKELDTVEQVYAKVLDMVFLESQTPLHNEFQLRRMFLESQRPLHNELQLRRMLEEF